MPRQSCRLKQCTEEEKWQIGQEEIARSICSLVLVGSSAQPEMLLLT